MTDAPLVRRVEILEEKVELLSQLPERVTAVQANLRGLRAEMRGEFARINDRFTTVDGEFASLRKEIRDGDEETRRQMRVLHEDVIARVALIQEGLSRANRPPAQPKRRRPKHN